MRRRNVASPAVVESKSSGTVEHSKLEKKSLDKNHKDRKGSLRRLLRVAKSERKTILLAMVALVVSSGTNMAFPTIMGKVIDRTAGGSSKSSGLLSDKVSYEMGSFFMN